MNPSQNQVALLVETARLYYDHHYSQQEIARKLSISRPSVSRLLQQAREQGIVRIKIVDPLANGTELERRLKQAFRLKEAIVVPNEGGNAHEIKTHLGQAAAIFLDQIVRPGMILGISWGSTMREVVRHLRPRRVHDMTVVQLVGGVSKAEFDPHASEIAQKMGQNYQAASLLLPLPAIVDHAGVKRAMLSDRNIARTLELARNADVAMFSVGTFDREALMVQTEYFNDAEIDYLLQHGAVGDICSRIIDARGDICWPELDARSIGIELRDLRAIPTAVAVAGGRRKLPAIHAGLLGKHFNVLITDEWVAGKLLHLAESNDSSL